MRRARVDDNQKEIVADLRKVGCTVEHLHTVGKGVPDLLVGYAGKNHLLEVKDGNKPPSARRLTPDQELWHAGWRGNVFTVTSTADALVCMGINPVERGWRD